MTITSSAIHGREPADRAAAPTAGLPVVWVDGGASAVPVPAALGVAAGVAGARGGAVRSPPPGHEALLPTGIGAAGPVGPVGVADRFARVATPGVGGGAALGARVVVAAVLVVVAARVRGLATVGGTASAPAAGAIAVTWAVLALAATTFEVVPGAEAGQEGVVALLLLPPGILVPAGTSAGAGAGHPVLSGATLVVAGGNLGHGAAATLDRARSGCRAALPGLRRIRT